MKARLLTTLAAALVATAVSIPTFSETLTNNMSLSGEVTSKTIGDLIEAVKDAKRIHLPFESIELEINSPGGEVLQMKRFLGVLRDSGMRIKTQNFGMAASAAADIFLIGDERVMGKDATILFHEVRIQAGELTLTVTDMKSLRDTGELPKNTSATNVLALALDPANVQRLNKIKQLIKTPGFSIIDDMIDEDNTAIAYIADRLHMTEKEVREKIIVPNVDQTFTAQRALELGIATSIV